MDDRNERLKDQIVNATNLETGLRKWIPRDPWASASPELLREAEELEAVLLVHEDLVPCMEQGCVNKRCIVPGEGPSVLCRYHTTEVLMGRAKAPPIRRNLDYQSVNRRTFLVDDYFIPNLTKEDK